MTTTNGKRYREAVGSFDRDREYLPADAIKILKGLPDARFDETIEIAFRLGLDTRKQDQTLRGTVSLPHGTGKIGPGGRVRSGRQGTRGPRGGSRCRRW